MTARGQIGTMSPRGDASGHRSWALHRWHKEPHVSAWPKAFKHFDDPARLFREQILPGHLPAAPLLSPEDAVVTLGSCFAKELRHVLETANFAAASFWLPSGLNNTFAILDFVSWCVTGEATSAGYRYERGADGTIEEWMPDAERAEYRKQFERAGAFVFTIGLAEVWSDRETGAVFWRGVPEAIFEEERHVFRLSSVDENEANLRRVVDLIRQVNPRAPIVLTLSPVPLEATFRPVSCVSADSVSKSVLRVALDRAMQDAPAHVYYWPSFELVKWAGAVFDWRAYSGADTRHVDRHLVQCIVEEFARTYYGAAAAELLRERLAQAGERVANRHRLRVAYARARRTPGQAVSRARILVSAARRS